MMIVRLLRSELCIKNNGKVIHLIAEHTVGNTQWNTVQVFKHSDLRLKESPVVTH